MLTSGESYCAFWAPRIGAKAAAARWRATRDTLRGYLLGVVGLLLALAAGRAGWTVLMGGGLALAGVALWLLFAGVYRMFAANFIIGEALGLPIGPGHIAAPPRSAAKYEKWCVRHGVVPYAAA